MEKTNELNKFLSYIHMGTSIYRIYYEQAQRFNNKDLIDLIVEIEEIFKKHEEKITSLIKDMGEEATDSLTASGLMGLYKEKLKIFDDSFDIMIAAIKSTNMGLLSSMKFLHQNKDLPDDVKKHVINVVKDYSNIITKLTNHSLRKML